MKIDTNVDLDVLWGQIARDIEHRIYEATTDEHTRDVLERYFKIGITQALVDYEHEELEE